MSHSISSYEKALKKAREVHPNSFEITGDTCLVAVIPQDDLAPQSSITIVSGGVRQVNSLEAKRPVLVQVLEVGPGFYDDEGQTTPSGVSIGDVLLVGSNSVQEISQFGMLQSHGRGVTLGLCNASERMMRWPGRGEFKAYFETVLKEVAND